MLIRRLSPLLLVLACVIAAAGCSAPVDASKARSRAVIESGGIVSADELRVAEYLNYYEQRFPEPVDNTLGLNLRLGNPQIPTDGGEAWLQLGVQARSTKNDIVAPLNLALVIDCSGSMADPKKMPYLKASLRVFLQSLTPDDIVSIVAYNTNPDVILPAQRVGDRRWIDATIQRLQPSRRTNLHGGLMLGFREVEGNLDIRRNNRVILLTDGIANEGVTDPEQIAADAAAYNERGIYLSTIGLGLDYNDELLSKLATQGKGAYHFVDSAEEMDKIFRQEVTGLVQKAAADVSVILTPESGVEVMSVTGYEGRPPAGPLQIRLRDMGTGDSQVVLAHLNIGPGGHGRRSLVQAELRYTDLFAQRQESIQQSAIADAGAMSYYDPLQDLDLLRNATIQRTAEGLKEIDRLYRAQRYQEAWELAYRLEQDLRQVGRLAGDEQMYRDADTMRQYQDTLAGWVESQTGRPPRMPGSVDTERDGEDAPLVPTRNVLEIE